MLKVGAMVLPSAWGFWQTGGEEDDSCSLHGRIPPLHFQFATFPKQTGISVLGTWQQGHLDFEHLTTLPSGDWLGRKRIW